MAWYKKQLAEKLKESGGKKTTAETTKQPTKPAFSFQKLTGKKNNFVSPVAARNRNRKKTDLP